MTFYHSKVMEKISIKKLSKINRFCQIVSNYRIKAVHQSCLFNIKISSDTYFATEVSADYVPNTMLYILMKSNCY